MFYPLAAHQGPVRIRLFIYVYGYVYVLQIQPEPGLVNATAEHVIGSALENSLLTTGRNCAREARFAITKSTTEHSAEILPNALEC